MLFHLTSQNHLHISANLALYKQQRKTDVLQENEFKKRKEKSESMKISCFTLSSFCPFHIEYTHVYYIGNGTL